MKLNQPAKLKKTKSLFSVHPQRQKKMKPIKVQKRTRGRGLLFLQETPQLVCTVLADSPNWTTFIEEFKASPRVTRSFETENSNVHFFSTSYCQEGFSIFFVAAKNSNQLFANIGAFGELIQRSEILIVFFDLEVNATSGLTPDILSKWRIHIDKSRDDKITSTKPQILLIINESPQLKFNPEDLVKFTDCFDVISVCKVCIAEKYGFDVPFQICYQLFLNKTDTDKHILVSNGSSENNISFFVGMDVNRVPNIISRYSSSLTSLDLCSNKITDIVPLCSCINLRSLNLSDNTIVEIPSEIHQLVNLTYLNIENNQISSLPPDISSLINLTVFKAQKNAIKTLPYEILHLTSLKTLEIRGNPLYNIPEGLMEGSLETIKEYLEDLKQKKEDISPEEWRKIKVLILGEENVGKSHLCCRLTGKEYKANVSTDGIEITTDCIISEKCEASIYDFGGQLIFYPTHHFFLSRKAIYIVVFNLVSPKWGRICYWLQTIRSISIETPVIVVATHADQYKGTKEQRAAIKTRLKKMKGGNRIKSILFVSCKKVECSKEIRSEVDAIARQHSILKKTVPKYYIATAKIIRSASQTTKILSWTDYTRLLQKPYTSLVQMTAFFHDVGILFWFKESDKLSDMVVLDPKWLIGVMSSIVSFKFNWKNGIIDHHVLQTAWKQYDEELHPKLLALLERFDVIVPMTGSNKGKKSLIPCMFDTMPDSSFISQRLLFDRPELCTFRKGKIIHRIERLYKFGFQPLGFFSKLVVRLLQETMELNLQSCYWQNGFFFEKDGQLALLEYGRDKVQGTTKGLEIDKMEVEEEDSYTMRVVVLLEQASNRYHTSNVTFFPMLIESIESILRATNPEGTVQRLAVCPHCWRRSKMKSTESITEFDIATLIKLFNMGQTFILCGEVPVYFDRMVPDICLVHVPLVGAEFREKEKIGEGGFGIVYRAWVNETGVDEQVAIKELKTMEDEAGLVSKFVNFSHEVSMMSKFEHPNLVRLLGIKTDPLLCMVLEYCPHSSLSSLLYKNSSFKMSERYKLRIALDISRGLHCLHSVVPPLIHRDLRSPNVFLYSLDDNSPVVAKIGDFGLSEQASPSVQELLRTWQWLAPEVIDALFPKYDERSDIYSLGCVLYEIYSRILPFVEFSDYNQYNGYVNRRIQHLSKEQLSDNQLLEKLKKHGWRLDLEKKIAFSDEWKEQKVKTDIIENNLRPDITQLSPAFMKTLIFNCWQKDPSLRPKVHQIVSEIESCFKQEDIVFQLQTNQAQKPFKATRRDRSVRHCAEFQLDPFIGEDKILCMTLVPPTGEIWCGGKLGKIYLIRWKEGKFATLSYFDGGSRITCLSYLHPYVWVACENGKVYAIPERYDNNFICKEGHTAEVRSICKVPWQSSELLLTGDINGLINVWNPLGCTLVTSLSISKDKDKPTPVFDMCVSRIGPSSHLWIASYQSIILIELNVSLQSPTVPQLTIKDQWQAHSNRIRSILTIDHQLWTCSTDAICIWDLNEVIRQNDSPKTSRKPTKPNEGTRKCIRINGHLSEVNHMIKVHLPSPKSQSITVPSNIVDFFSIPFVSGAKHEVVEESSRFPLLPASRRNTPLSSSPSPPSSMPPLTPPPPIPVARTPELPVSRVNLSVSLPSLPPLTPTHEVAPVTGRVFRNLPPPLPSLSLSNPTSPISHPPPRHEPRPPSVVEHVWSGSFDRSVLLWVPKDEDTDEIDAEDNDSTWVTEVKPTCLQELIGHKGSVDFLLAVEAGIVCSTSTSGNDKSIHFWTYHKEGKEQDAERFSIGEVLNEL